MNCFVCTAAGRATIAVGVCPVCGAGLCIGHRAGERAQQPGGTSIGCSHATIDVAQTNDRMRGIAR
jgi:hypothetical protein